MKTSTNNKGFSLIELLISMAILGLILGGLAVLFSGNTKSYMSQSEIVEMQDSARLAMDFVARMLRSNSGSVTIAGIACNNSITATFVEDAGRSTGGNDATHLNDTAKSWTTGQWGNYSVSIINGTGSGQTRTISSNTITQLTNANWTTTPDATSEYNILSNNTFSRDSVANTLLYAKNASGNTSLAENITCFTVGQSGSRIDITITAETPNPMPATGNKGTITLKSSVYLRN
ncbi:MAG: prepilin-type N-terminal cleavage/methylation domain-containing protein [Nitrospirae bacterium]|nr:prepilin-type N-terminal cleavage/methylation domain-containing protein [Nitrospirota bacterium]MCL5977853.1 prepilin-type N-terminal cleavage/methylation domain-containing protein [Nitrospirota bacterium]